MSNEDSGNNPPPGEEKLPATTNPPTWEIVLEKAADESQNPSVAPTTAATTNWSRLAKMAFPALVLVIYGLYKLWGAGLPSFAREGDPGGPSNPTSLTGVAPATEEFQRVARDKQLREFVAKLEAAASRQEWRTMTTLVSEQTDPKVRDHPVVKALVALARTRSGERSMALEAELIDLDVVLRGAGTQYAVLSEEVRVARIDQAISRNADWDILRRNTDLFLQLLGPAAETPYEVQVRQKLARLYEAVADEIDKNARGIINNDAIALREARSAHQAGLRVLVEARGWASLKPISAGTSPDIERLVEKIRILNRAIHGPSLPFTSGDSSTWTGTKGDPFHTPPGGEG
jgi:hypothetical protein